MISYGGINLYETDAAPIAQNIIAYLERFGPTDQVHEFEPHPWPDPLMPGLALRPARRLPPIQINTLHWPRDACRFAVGWFLATGHALQQIWPQVYACGGSGASAGIGSGSGSGSSNTGICPLPLILDDGANRPVTAQMFMLPPRPILQTPRLTGLEIISGSGSASASASASAFSNELYLLTFVDERYFWWYEYGPIGGISWTQLFAGCFANLRIPASVTAIPGQYLTPGPSFLADYASTPQSIDAAAFQTNTRLVRTLDGAVSVQSYTQAVAVENVNLQHMPDPNGPERQTGWRKVLGGTFRFLFDRFLPSDLEGLIPFSVTCIFPRYNAQLAAHGSYQKLIRLTDTGLTATGAPYAGIKGFYGSKPTLLDQPAQYSTAASPTPNNQSDLDALALQWATDWYLWQLARLDWTYSGLIPWVPNGLDDKIVWTHHANTLTTRVLRGPLNDVAVPVVLPPPCCASAGGSGTGAGLTVTVVTGICTLGSGTGSGSGSGSGATKYWCIKDGGGLHCLAVSDGSTPMPNNGGPYDNLHQCVANCNP